MPRALSTAKAAFNRLRGDGTDAAFFFGVFLDAMGAMLAHVALARGTLSHVTAGLFVAITSVAIVACGGRSGLDGPSATDASGSYDAHHDADVIAVDAPDDVAPDVPSSPLCATFDGGVAKTVCTSDVQVGALEPSSSTCFVDTVVHEGDQGFVNYTCANDPSTWAGAKFATGIFTGAVTGTVVDLCTGTTFPWSDGCTWASAQRITGDLASGVLAFTYEEKPIAGTNCASPCGASGPIYVH